jgi:hypothetical protein
MGLDEEAAPGPVGPGEGASSVSEELALEQRFGDGATIHRHESLIAPWRLGVDRPREDLLAGPALPRQQDRRLEGGDAFHDLEQLDHGGRGGDDGPIAGGPLDVAAEQLVRASKPFPFLRLSEGQEDLAGLEGLGDVVVGPPFHGLDGEILRAVGRHQDDGGSGKAL